MQTIFSHIIQKRFSQVNEDVATDALAFVLHSSDAARNGMMKLLRGIASDLPELYFRTQQAKGAIRPDMWGFADDGPRVYIENKFWAGLTDNQPVSYLKQLAKYAQPTILLVVAPAKREPTIWRELLRRLDSAGISESEREAAPAAAYAITTGLGPILALTSWSSILSVMEHEAADDPSTRCDLVQLRALCDAVDNNAFPPISLEQVSEQRTPAFLLQLSALVQAAVGLAVTEGVLSTKGAMPQASWERIGRFARLSGTQGPGAWMGTHFRLWKTHGGTPLWLVFRPGKWGRAEEVGRLIVPWAAREGVLTTTTSDHEFAIALDISVGEEKAGVVRSLVDDLREISRVLDALPPG